jgi:hypothetical protein
MDPYLEAHWGDVHQSLVIYARDQLQGSLPSDLRARVEERVFVETEEGTRRSVYPDVRVIQRPYSVGSEKPRAGGVAIAEPLVVEVQHEPVTEGYIEILEVGSGHRVITVIEFVSLANKQPGAGRDLYLRKQRELVEGGVNSVEIDLLRSGQYVLSVPQDRIPPEYRTPYRICVRRVSRPLAYEVYRVAIEEPLPTIRIPLRKTDDDAILNLQSLVDQCYRNGGYDDLNYAADPTPPLDSQAAAWAARLLREKGLRA